MRKRTTVRSAPNTVRSVSSENELYRIGTGYRRAKGGVPYRPSESVTAGRSKPFSVPAGLETRSEPRNRTADGARTVLRIGLRPYRW
ncbi:hypothetical protein [Haladaptatus salinisoli]|uniref:hypothetical protein n=1 Tax=Haladaptatus salinisoli TaxID=2884876 RepID=UPI001D0B2285|nr:hypothetical protein [Haladaptatus salinisoli]